MQDQPAQVALTANLRDADYVRIVCGTLDELPRAFADLVRSGQPRPVRLSTATPGTPPCAVASASGRSSPTTAQHPHCPAPDHLSEPSYSRRPPTKS